MTKKINISEAVYQELLKVKNENESFSELFMRLIFSQKQRVEKLFGSWNLTEEEKADIWDKICNKEARNWKNPKKVN
jgi:predicted CopG family antitoxin